MSTIEILFYSDLWLFAFSAIIIPLIIIIFGILLYRYKPACRLANGFALLILGGMGLLFYPLVSLLYSSNWMYDAVVVAEIIRVVFIVILFIEILTFYVGIKSLRNRKITKK